MKALIHSTPGFEVSATLTLTYGGMTFSVFTRWPEARSDTSDHLALQLTLPAEALQRLGALLDKATSAVMTSSRHE